jgi:drug/metabolite transporter (DMT)-like permease
LPSSNSLDDAAGPRHLPASGLVLLAALTLLWGLNWPAMRVILAEMPPWHFRVLCLGAGGGALLLVAWLRGRPIAVPRAERWPLVASSLTGITGWHMLTAFGLMLIEAGRASIIAFTMPVWVAILAGPVLGERIDRRHWTALALGVGGLGLLILPAMGRIGAAPLGSLFVLGGAWSWAVGTLILKRRAWSIPAVSMAGWQLLIGGAPVVLGAIVFESDVSIVPVLAAMSPRALWALVFTLTLPMVLCQFAWFRLVELFPANIAAISTLAVPVVGLASGWLLLGEQIGMADVLAMALVVMALALVLVIHRKK